MRDRFKELGRIVILIMFNAMRLIKYACCAALVFATVIASAASAVSQAVSGPGAIPAPSAAPSSSIGNTLISLPCVQNMPAVSCNLNFIQCFNVLPRVIQILDTLFTEKITGFYKYGQDVDVIRSVFSENVTAGTDLFGLGSISSNSGSNSGSGSNAVSALLPTQNIVGIPMSPPICNLLNTNPAPHPVATTAAGSSNSGAPGNSAGSSAGNSGGSAQTTQSITFLGSENWPNLGQEAAQTSDSNASDATSTCLVEYPLPKPSSNASPSVQQSSQQAAPAPSTVCITSKGCGTPWSMNSQGAIQLVDTKNNVGHNRDTSFMQGAYVQAWRCFFQQMINELLSGTPQFSFNATQSKANSESYSGTFAQYTQLIAGFANSAVCKLTPQCQMKSIDECTTTAFGSSTDSVACNKHATCQVMTAQQHMEAAFAYAFYTEWMLRVQKSWNSVGKGSNDIATQVINIVGPQCNSQAESQCQECAAFMGVCITRPDCFPGAYNGCYGSAYQSQFSTLLKQIYPNSGSCQSP